MRVQMFDRLLAVLSITTVLLPVCSYAGVDLLGVYFNEQASNNCIETWQVGVYHCYVVAEDVSEPTGISGWQLRIGLDPGLYFLSASVSYPTEGVNFLDPPDFMVGYGEPLVSTPLITLMEFDIFVQSEGGIYIEDLSPELNMLYLGQTNGEIPFQYRFGGDDEYVAVIGNLDCPEENDFISIPTTTNNWSEVKSLYAN